jgi:hypothetical protein
MEMNELRDKREVSGKASAIPSTRLLPLTAYHWPPTQGLMRDQPEQERGRDEPRERGRNRRTNLTASAPERSVPSD